MTYSQFTVGDVRGGVNTQKALFDTEVIFLCRPLYIICTACSTLQPVSLQNTKLMISFQVANTVLAPSHKGKSYCGKN